MLAMISQVNERREGTTDERHCIGEDLLDDGARVRELSNLCSIEGMARAIFGINTKRVTFRLSSSAKSSLFSGRFKTPACFN